jgi:hypothetical protein
MAEATKKDTKSQYEVSFRKDYESDWDVHRKYIATFDPLEAMLIGQVYDAVSNSIDSSKITDSYTATLAIERAARVMGKLPEGTVEAGKADMGKAAFMDILRQKWIYPNANSQFPFETKMEMAQLYADVYGYMPVFYDWNVNVNGYVGPDCWLWSPRNLVFQQGRNFFADMDYITALTWVGKSFIDDILDEEGDEDGWDRDALKELQNLCENETAGNDTEQDTQVERTRVSQGSKKGICLATRYEAGDEGEWVTFAPDHSYVEVRRLPNPHKNGRIPFRIKYSQELYDSVYGLSEFARAKPLQFARDGLTNFYFKGIKMNLIPPIIANANGVLKHTLDYREGAVMMETIPNSIRRLETSNAGLATYQAAQSSLTGSLLSLFGTQNASMPGAETLNPSQGKTPAAIGLYSDKEATRDGRARKRLENLIEELTEAFFSLIANMGTETIPVDLYAKDLEAIDKAGMGDVRELFQNFQPNDTFTGGTLKIDPTKFKDIELRFHVLPGSTAKVNPEAQRTELLSMMDTIAKFQNQFKDDPSIEVNWGAIMKSFEGLSNVPGAGEFVTMKTPEQVKQIQEQQAQAEAAANQPAQAPLDNPIQTPGGQMVEMADLAKMYTAVETPDDVKNAILQAIGFAPSTLPTPSTTQQALAHAKIIDMAENSARADKQHTDNHNLAVATAVSGERQADEAAKAAKAAPAKTTK